MSARTILLFPLCLALSGCQGGPIRSFFDAPPVEYQRRSADTFVDPYPAPYAGPGSDQVRPPGFEHPTNETRQLQSSPWAQSRLNPSNWFGR